MVFVKEWEENYNVCPRCDFHDRIGPAKRFEQLFDAAEYELLPAPEVREDPLRFKDTKRYTERLKAARAATAERDALINARGRIDGHRVVIGVQDFAFMGGSMGIAVGAALVAGIRDGDRGQVALHPVHRRRRRPHAGRHLEPDANAAQHRRAGRASAKPACPISSSSPTRPRVASPLPTPCSATCRWQNQER